MKYGIVALLMGSMIWIAQGQQLYTDSLLQKPFDSVFFSSTHSYWMQVVPSEDRPILELPGWGHVIAYSKAGLQTTGTLLPGKEKSYFSYRNILETEADTLLIRLSGDHPLFDLSLAAPIAYSRKEWRAQERQRLIVHALFFGVVIVMALYNLMIYFSVKDQSYLWYVFSIVGFGLYMAFYYGFSYEHLWPSWPHWNAYFFALIIPLTNVSRILFTQTYLHTDQYVPRWHRFFKVLLGLYLIPIGMWLISWLGIQSWVPETNYVIGFLGTTTMIAITITSILTYIRGYQPALWFLIAFALFNVGGILFIFMELNYLPDNFLTRYIIQLGTVAQVVLFSLGLSSRLNRTHRLLANEKIEKEKLAREQEREKKLLIEEQRNALEQQVQHRTRELETTLRQLKLSENELRELNQLKSKLFSIISHELKSPLTTVDSYLNLFINHYHKLSPEELTQVSNKTRFSLQNLTLLMDNLLLWSRLQQNSLIINPVAVDLRKVIDRAIKLFSLMIEEKDISLNIDPEIDDTVLFGDKDMMEFVVRNLLHNALKFTPKQGAVHLFVRHQETRTQVFIQDTGIGMSRKMIDQILHKGEGFTRFGTDKEKGSGIGLILCKDFVEKNHGTMNIQAHQGTTVSFTAPHYMEAETA